MAGGAPALLWQAASEHHGVRLSPPGFPLAKQFRVALASRPASLVVAAGLAKRVAPPTRPDHETCSTLISVHGGTTTRHPRQSLRRHRHRLRYQRRLGGEG